MFRVNPFFKQKTDKQWQRTISTYPVSVIGAGVCWKTNIYHHLSGNLLFKKGVYPEHFCTFCVAVFKASMCVNFTTLVVNFFFFFFFIFYEWAFCYHSRVVVGVVVFTPSQPSNHSREEMVKMHCKWTGRRRVTDSWVQAIEARTWKKKKHWLQGWLAALFFLFFSDVLGCFFVCLFVCFLFSWLISDILLQTQVGSKPDDRVLLWFQNMSVGLNCLRQWSQRLCFLFYWGRAFCWRFFMMAFTCMAVIFSFCLMMLFTLSIYFFGLMIRGFFSFLFFLSLQSLLTLNFTLEYKYFVSTLCLLYHVAIVYSRPTVSISRVLQVASHVFIFLVTTCTFPSNLNKSLLLYMSLDKVMCVYVSASVCLSVGVRACMWVILWVIVCVCVCVDITVSQLLPITEQSLLPPFSGLPVPNSRLMVSVDVKQHWTWTTFLFLCV